MAPSKPLLIYDGDCAFCRRWIARWKNITGDRVDYAPYQEVLAQLPQVPKKDLETAVVLLEPTGKIYHAAEAVFRSLAASPRHEWLLRAYYTFPGMRALSEALYAFVARNRKFFSKLS